MTETDLQTPMSVRERGKRCIKSQNRDFPIACGADLAEAAVPLQPMKSLLEQNLPAAWGGLHTRTGVPKGGCDPVGTHTGTHP